MLHKIGLLVVLAAGFLVTVLTVALAATPVVIGLERLYQYKSSKQAQPKTQETADDPYRCMVEDENGRPIPKSDCPVGTIDHPHDKLSDADFDQVKANDDAGPWDKFAVNKTDSTVVVHEMSIDFPAGMTDDAIDKAIRKSFPAGAKYDIWHTVPKGGVK